MSPPPRTEGYTMVPSRGRRKRRVANLKSPRNPLLRGQSEDRSRSDDRGPRIYEELEAGREDRGDILRLWVNHGDCAKIIGRRAEELKNMQRRSGCKIRVQNEKDMNSKKERFVEIIGPESRQKECMDMVLELTAFCRDADGNILKDERPMSIDNEVMVLHVPAEDVGRIIGRGGENIKKIEKASTTKLQVDKETGKVEIYGAKANQEKALELTLEEVTHCVNADGQVLKDEPRNQKNGEDRGEPLKLWVKNRECGKVIGRAGETIREIMDKTNCEVKVQKVQDSDEGSGERMVEIFGSPEDQGEAMQMVLNEITWCRGVDGIIKERRRRSRSNMAIKDQADNDVDSNGGTPRRRNDKKTEDVVLPPAAWICKHCGGDHRSRECPKISPAPAVPMGMQMGMPVAMAPPMGGKGMPGMPPMMGMPPGMAPMGAMGAMQPMMMMAGMGMAPMGGKGMPGGKGFPPGMPLAAMFPGLPAKTQKSRSRSSDRSAPGRAGKDAKREKKAKKRRKIDGEDL